MDENSIFLGKGEKPVSLDLRFANRHGLIAGATGTGKTVSLQVLAEGFSRAGVPAFMPDIKGDLSGISQPGKEKPKVTERCQQVGLGPIEFQGSPTIFWDILGESGHPVRATVSDLGPLLFSRLLSLNETQEGVLNVAFKVADDNGLLLLDLKDLTAVLGYVNDHRAELINDYGNVSPASVGAIRRALLVLEQQGAEDFFGEPALDIRDLMRTSRDGRGYMNVLAADKLFHNPRLYSTMLLWLLAELFEQLPETGDPDRPNLVFFFDEAHLLFDGASRAFMEKVELVVRLIRSKGVGVYFITQNPDDVPDDILGQLGNRIQHALRAFTPRDQKAVRAASETFRPNPNFDTETAITQLGVGEALVSVLEEKGAPSVVERAIIRPPASRIGPITPEERQWLTVESPVRGLYDEPRDRDSAWEMLQHRVEQTPPPEPERRRAAAPRASSRQSLAEAMLKTAGRTASRRLTEQIVRTVLGTLFKGR